MYTVCAIYLYIYTCENYDLHICIFTFLNSAYMKKTKTTLNHLILVQSCYFLSSQKETILAHLIGMLPRSHRHS